ncbi:hypothetical protein [Aquibacillus saliphilus]|uniref:hypothetical protein n=1 Tax=Aquibacillus saliphilus TaxID=1909422 RepID=UPI001CF02FAC|nr:hypothetical protein [Aquibacillus saliphilus]
MKVNEIQQLEVGMWIKTNTGLVAKVKSIDNRFPLRSENKFPIIYADDNKTCWSFDTIEQFGWNININ